MALDGTYAGLRASIADFLNRGDLAAQIPDFIRLAEVQISRRLRVRRMAAREPAFVIGAALVAAPSDFLGPISLSLADGAMLDCLAPDALAQARAASGGGGRPGAYAVVGDQLEFDQTPAAPLIATLVYYARPPALAGAGSNWILADHPDAYLYGALLQSAPYLQDDARLGVWAELFTTLLADIQGADDRESFGARLSPRTSQVA